MCPNSKFKLQVKISREICPDNPSLPTGRPNGITDRKIIFKLFMRFIADTDTDKNCFGINYS